MDMHFMHFTPDANERLTGADKALDDLLEKYQVDICRDANGDYFFDLRETKLTLVPVTVDVDICD